MSPVFLSSKFFDAREFLKHRTDQLQSFSALWDKIFPTEISDLLFLFKRCFATRIYLKHGRGPLRSFSALWVKNFSIEFSDMPFLWIRFSDARFFLKHRRVPLQMYLVVRDKKCLKISWCNPSSLIKKICETRKFLKHRSVSPRKFLAPWNKKLSTENSDIPLFSVRFFEILFFLKERRVAIRYFSGLWDTDFDKNRDTRPSSLIHKFFR